MEIYPKGARLSGDRRAEAVSVAKQMYESGASVRRIAARIGRSYGNTHRLLEEAGVDLRSRGGNQKAAK